MELNCYQDLRLINNGDFAKVYHGLYKSHNVAVKIIPRDDEETAMIEKDILKIVFDKDAVFFRLTYFLYWIAARG